MRYLFLLSLIALCYFAYTYHEEATQEWNVKILSFGEKTKQDRKTRQDHMLSIRQKTSATHLELEKLEREHNININAHEANTIKKNNENKYHISRYINTSSDEKTAIAELKAEIISVDIKLEEKINHISKAKKEYLDKLAEDIQKEEELYAQKSASRKSSTSRLIIQKKKKEYDETVKYLDGEEKKDVAKLRKNAQSKKANLLNEIKALESKAAHINKDEKEEKTGQTEDNSLHTDPEYNTLIKTYHAKKDELTTSLSSLRENLDKLIDEDEHLRASETEAASNLIDSSSSEIMKIKTLSFLGIGVLFLITVVSFLSSARQRAY